MENGKRAFTSRQLTRRKFLKMLGVVGGATAVFGAMEAWGMSDPDPPTIPPVLNGDNRGTSVLIIGAGVAGLVAAFELAQVGYDVRVLEARDRVGGKVYTVRGGTVSEEIGTYPQLARFSPGQYYNAGAMRIPYSHQATLYYTKQFGIKLIQHSNVNLQAYSYQEHVPGQDGGRKLHLREVYADMTGYTSEILAKAIDQDKLDLALSEEDQEALIEYLIHVGILSSNDLDYGPNTSRGYAQMPGPGEQPGIPSPPLPFDNILQFGTATARQMSIFYRMAPIMEMQSTMLTPEDGMSAIYEQGFLPQLRNRITFNADIRKIFQSPNGMWVDYRDKESGRDERFYADYCVCTIPLSVLKDIPAEFSPQFKEAIVAGSNFQSTGKIGLQFRRRFWEEDQWIYGGISFTDVADIGSISYPTYGYQTQKGVVQGYYNFEQAARTVGNLSPEERIARALEIGTKIHGEDYLSDFENGFSVFWDRVRYSLGGWALWSSDALQQSYPTLLNPEGRVYLAGDSLSYLPGWQQGAITSAWTQIEKLHQRVAQAQHLTSRQRQPA